MTFRQPPLWLVRTSWLVIVVAAGMAVAGAIRTGVAWDETYHVMRFRNFQDHGWYALDWDFSGEGPGEAGKSTYAYGPITMIVLHLLGLVIGVDDGSHASATTDGYIVRHLGVVVIGLVGTAATAAVGRALLGSWRWGVVAAAVLAATPLWTGHMMFNIKDTPVATGCTVFTLGLVLLLHDRPSHRIRVATVLCLSGGAVLAVGTRPGIWTALAAGAMAYLVAVAVLAATRPDGRRIALRSGELAFSVAVAATALVLVYPNAFGSPGKILGRSAETSAHFREGSGIDYLYLPVHALTDVPLVGLGLFLAGSVLSAATVLTRRSDRVVAGRLLIVGAQALALPLAAIAIGSDLYNGLRQVTFVAPACALLATFALATWVSADRVRREVRAGALVTVAALGLIVPLAGQAAAFPYQYSNTNLLVTVLGADPETDYWRTSFRELLHELPTDGQVVCSPLRDEQDRALRLSFDGNVDCRTDPIGPVAAWWADHGKPLAYEIDQRMFYVLVERGLELPANCVILDSVERWVAFRSRPMSLLGRCSMPVEPVPEGGVVLDGSVRSWSFAVTGWNARTEGRMESRGPSARVALSPPAACARAGCTVVMQGDFPADLVARSGAALLPIGRLGQDAVEVGLPTGPVPEEGTWIELTRSSGRDLHVRLERLDLRRD